MTSTPVTSTSLSTVIILEQDRLESCADCANQRIEAPGRLTGTGVRYMRVAHEGNTRSSPEEAETIAALIEDLLKGEYVKQDGTSGPLAPEEIMVVAPYNAQVRCLSEHLPEGVRIGTVDKFQGQEAAVCFFSMATSSGEELPRNLEFLFSRNRLNVAISRARCLAVLVCNPALLHIRCGNAEQMRLLNALCLFVEMAGKRGGGRAAPGRERLTKRACRQMGRWPGELEVAIAFQGSSNSHEF
jgi:hypothetical protein